MDHELENKMDELLGRALDAPWKHPHIHGDCNRTYFEQAFPHVGVDGLWMEFGVYRGKTISVIAEYTKKTVYGFDSFEGLHEDWDRDNPKGAYSLGGIIPEEAIDGSLEMATAGQATKSWPPNVKLIKGYFEDVLPAFVQEHRAPVAFMHIDSDLYSSAKTILSQFRERIIPGTVICFDDWCGYPICTDRNHEIKAFAEFLLETGYSYEVLAYQTNSRYSQCAFIIQQGEQ
jgi:hypothetical protein